jgi:NodT family efflux transporter outer membrane factor (OMF) lipoprotein
MGTETDSCRRRRARSCLAAWLLVGTATAACSVGPEYKKPIAAQPTALKELPADGSTLARDWRAAQPRDDQIKGKWWETFGDPALNALEEQVSISNQNVLQAEAQFRAARAAVGTARADLFPTVTVGASVTHSRVSTNRSTIQRGTGTGSFVDYQVPIDFSYEADVWGRARRGIEAAVATAQASAADLQAMLLSTQSELASDYFQLHGTDAERQLLDSTVADYEKALQLTVNRFNQGVASGSDVEQARAQLESTRAQATELGIARAQFEHAIAILIGKPPADLTIPATPITVAPPPIPVALPSALVERRPDVAAAERRVVAANAEIGVAQAAYFPLLSLTASAGFESATIGNLLTLPSRLWSLGPALAETAFEGGRRRAVKEQAVANYDAAVAAYRQNVLAAFQDVEDNLAVLRVLADEAAQQEAAVASAERSLALANNRYAAGVAAYLEVITAQTAALANQRIAVDILTRRMTASSLLIKAVGGGWDSRSQSGTLQ